jgi:hypothetical protein
LKVEKEMIRKGVSFWRFWKRGEKPIQFLIMGRIYRQKSNKGFFFSWLLSCRSSILRLKLFVFHIIYQLYCDLDSWLLKNIKYRTDKNNNNPILPPRLKKSKTDQDQEVLEFPTLRVQAVGSGTPKQNTIQTKKKHSNLQ